MSFAAGGTGVDPTVDVELNVLRSDELMAALIFSGLTAGTAVVMKSIY